MSTEQVARPRRLRGRAAKEALYTLLGVPLGVLGLAYALVTLVVGAGLSVTALGVPLLALGLLGMRGLGSMHRSLARRLLGLDVGAPPPSPSYTGFFGWLRVRLADGAAWRAALYLLLKPIVGLLALVFMVAFWGYGLFFSTYVFWRQLLPVQRDSHGIAHQGIGLFGDYFVDSAPRALLFALFGVLLLVVARWVTQGALLPDRLLVRALLGTNTLAERVRDLEATRAYAVDDAATQLRRIERDLHDGTQARLVALALKLGMARDEADPARAQELLDSAHAHTKEALTELREIVRGIHPPILDSGLPAALESLVARAAVPTALEVRLAERPSPAIETIAYYCAAELLTNVARHANARNAAIHIGQMGDWLCLRVGDDGSGGARPSGVSAGDPAGGTGLTGLAHRVRAVDGRLDINSPRGGPTVVTVDLPLHAGGLENISTESGGNSPNARRDRGGLRSAPSGAGGTADQPGLPGARSGQ
ncbi:MAG TPA: sensor domain-containing protein [Pseudonocardiaceae bacterium]|nr:sensor domain-containing protein [Pseudonocardiaceae bacterium]